MTYRAIFFATLLIAVLAPGCKKGSSVQTCAGLQEAMTTNNSADARAILTQMINQLPSNTYSAQNLETLSSYLSGRCSLSSQVICFDCIKTLPSESEIRLSFNSPGSLITKTFDISYSPVNKMTVVGMHD